MIMDKYQLKEGTCIVLACKMYIQVHVHASYQKLTIIIYMQVQLAYIALPFSKKKKKIMLIVIGINMLILGRSDIGTNKN